MIVAAIILASLALAVYIIAVLPTPFFRVRRGDFVARCDQKPHRRLWTALAHDRPAVEMSVPELRRLHKLCPEPNRPWISWRNSQGYYDERPENPSDRKAPQALFASRFHLIALPLRAVLDPLLSLVLNAAFTTVYVGMLIVLAGVLRLTAFRHRAALTALPADRAPALKRHIQEHLDMFVDPAETGPISVLAEPGYFMFKLAEGRLFRRALDRFGAQHPNCEIGPDDGMISALHLAAVDRFDAALSATGHALSPKAKPYDEIRPGLLEDRPFGSRRFADIYLIHVTDHIPDLEPVMRILADMLEPGGRIYFSGLSHDFSGWWLERACAAGCVWNAWDLARYRDLCRRCGLEVETADYCQPFPASLFWKCTYGFAMKTKVWPILGGWFGAGAARRRLYQRLLRAMWTDVYLLEEDLIARSGKGLNFMITARKPAEPAA